MVFTRFFSIEHGTGASSRMRSKVCNIKQQASVRVPARYSQVKCRKTSHKHQSFRALLGQIDLVPRVL